MSGSGARDRHRRPHLHGAARPARRRLLPARVVRQVHAVPRGHALDGRPADAHRVRRRHELHEIDLLVEMCDRIEGKCLCPLGDACAMPVRSYLKHFRRRVRGRASGVGVAEGLSAPFGALVPGAEAQPPAGARLMATTESATVTVTFDGREVQVPAGTPLVVGGRARGRRDPGLLLRAAARAAGRRLPHVPGRGRDGRPPDAEAAGGLHDDGRRRHDRAQRRDVREGGGGAGRGPRVPAPEPPARLPGLRQGRRVPAAGPRRSGTGPARAG